VAADEPSAGVDPHVIIGLTGGVAAGKSTAAREFERLGAALIDADRIGHEVIAPGRVAWRELRRAFGDRILVPRAARASGSAEAARPIDRRVLGAIVFADPRARRRLNAIVHPRLIRELARRVAALTRAGRVVVIDAALLVELGWRDRVETLVVVDAPRELRVARLRRLGFSRRAALDRIGAQASRRDRLREADVVLSNAGTPAELRRRARTVWRQLVAPDGGGGRGPANATARRRRASPRSRAIRSRSPAHPGRSARAPRGDEARTRAARR